jgi:hypothetical protein
LANGLSPEERLPPASANLKINLLTLYFLPKDPSKAILLGYFFLGVFLVVGRCDFIHSMQCVLCWDLFHCIWYATQFCLFLIFYVFLGSVGTVYRDALRELDAQFASVDKMMRQEQSTPKIAVLVQQEHFPLHQV